MTFITDKYYLLRVQHLITSLVDVNQVSVALTDKILNNVSMKINAIN